MRLAEKVLNYAAKFRMFDGCETILCGVSGGADSVCLLHILKTSVKDRKICAVHFNHRLRGAEADRDESFVAELCGDMGIELYSGGGDVRAYAAEHKTGIEEAARKLRYDFFEATAGKIDGCRVATAHSADDNAETLLLNLVRGAGVNGLAGIPPVRGPFIRPLLCATRAEIEAYLAENGLRHVEDSTNRDAAYSRNKIRLEVIPVLKSINPAFIETASRAAELIREDCQYLSGEAERLLALENGACRLDIKKLLRSPAPLASRAVIAAAEKFGITLSSVNVAGVLKVAESRRASARIDLPGGLTAVKSYGNLAILKKTEAPEPETFEERELAYNAWTRLDRPPLAIFFGDADSPEAESEKKGAFCASPNTFFFEKSKICGKITVRPRKTGDVIGLPGPNRTGTIHKSLKKLFIELKIPRHERGALPVVCDELGVLAVCGLGQDARAAASGPEGKNTAVLIMERTRDDQGNKRDSFDRRYDR